MTVKTATFHSVDAPGDLGARCARAALVSPLPAPARREPFQNPAPSAAVSRRQSHEAIRAGDIEAATDFARSAVAAEPAEPAWRAQLGQLLIWGGAFPEAEHLASDLAAAPATIDLGERLMLELLRMRGDTDEMAAHWRVLVGRQRTRLRDHPLGRRGLRFVDHERGVLHRIGETATQLDTLVKMRLLGWREPGTDALLAPDTAVANQAYLECWQPYVNIIQDSDHVLELLPLSGELRVHTDFFSLPDDNVVAKDQAFAAVQREWEGQGRGPLLSLPPGARARGIEALRGIGMPADAWFVSAHVRESGYLRPHEAAIHAFRDADVLDARPAIASIVERGGWVVRLGDPTMRPLPEMPNVIDYAHSPLKCDWMDVFLLSQCRFMLGTTAGPSAVAATFGVPVVMTNVVPQPFRAYSQRDIFLPKLYRTDAEGRYLRFSEAMQPPLRWLWNGNILDEQGLTAVATSPQDIRDAVIEMMDRLDGTLTYSAADEAAQARYDGLFTHAEDYCVKSRVGRRFLARHRDLM